MTIVTDQRGNIFFYILLAVVLLAALSLAIASSMRGNSGVSNERLKLVASEIIEAGSRLSEAVSRMRLRGITDSAISFENPIVLAYNHAGCTVDTCRVFSGTGGGLSWEEGSPTASNGNPWGYTSDIAIAQVGTTDGELIAILPDVPLEVCQNINLQLGLGTASTPPANAGALGTLTKFVGTYTNSPVAFAPAALLGQKAGCFQATSATGPAVGAVMHTGKYFYYQVLITN